MIALKEKNIIIFIIGVGKENNYEHIPRRNVTNE